MRRAARGPVCRGERQATVTALVLAGGDGYEVGTVGRHQGELPGVPALAADLGQHERSAQQHAGEQDPDGGGDDQGGSGHRVRASMVLTRWSSSRGLNGLMT